MLQFFNTNLFRAKLVKLRHFPRKNFGALETFGVQNDFCDQLVIGHHHGDGTEESGQVIRKFGSSRVTGVHCDEGGASRYQLDLTALKHKPDIKF